MISLIRNILKDLTGSFLRPINAQFTIEHALNVIQESANAIDPNQNNELQKSGEEHAEAAGIWVKYQENVDTTLPQTKAISQLT